MTPVILVAALVFPEAQPDPRPGASNPVGMVLSTKGAVMRERGKDKPRRLASMDLLAAGDRLSAADRAEAQIVFLADGHRERLKSGARATVGEKGCDPETAVERQAGQPL